MEPTLFHAAAGDGTEIRLFFKDGLINVITRRKEEVDQVVLANVELSEKEWHCITITHAQGRLLSSARIMCFLNGVLMETAKLSAMIFAIIWGVLIYVRFLGFADLPSAFSDWIVSLDQSPLLTLLFILCAYAVLGMFMDAIGMLLLTLPVVFPAIIALNGGPDVTAAASAFGVSAEGCAIWFGIIVVKMASKIISK